MDPPPVHRPAMVSSATWPLTMGAPGRPPSLQFCPQGPPPWKDYETGMALDRPTPPSPQSQHAAVPQGPCGHDVPRLLGSDPDRTMFAPPSGMEYGGILIFPLLHRKLVSPTTSEPPPREKLGPGSGAGGVKILSVQESPPPSLAYILLNAQSLM